MSPTAVEVEMQNSFSKTALVTSTPLPASESPAKTGDPQDPQDPEDPNLDNGALKEQAPIYQNGGFEVADENHEVEKELANVS